MCEEWRGVGWYKGRGNCHKETKKNWNNGNIRQELANVQHNTNYLGLI